MGNLTMHGKSTRRLQAFETLIALVGAAFCYGAVAGSGNHDRCIRDVNEQAINTALSEPGSRVFLCQGAEIAVSHPIVLKSANQELATEGSPTGSARAVIRVIGSDQSTAIESRASGVHLHHLIVDGQRRKLGRLAKGGALIELGGDAAGIRIDHIRSFDPRGWSTMHVFEGGGHCRGARITDSEFGPAGSPDGAWADGISFACRDGLIANNRVIDASDGGIVIFGAPGTIVRNNVVQTNTNTLLGGINLVDYKPFDGDYSGVIVRNNLIEAKGGFIKVAIAAGPAAWGIATARATDVNHGARVIDNRILGSAFGYGIVADGVSGFTFEGNRVQGPITGGLDSRCDADHAHSGIPFLRERGNETNLYQSDFVEGETRWSICVQPRL